MYTTTEKLILAYAVTEYSPQNVEKINKYLMQRSLDIDTKLWPEVYNDLKKEMAENGYTNIIAYCQDRRYEKLIEQFNLTLKIRDLIIENKIDPLVYLNSIKQTDLQKQKINHEDVAKYFSTSFKHKQQDVSKASVAFIKPRGKETVEEKMPINTEIDVQVDVYNKQNKKYYLRMTQQERDFDDYLDTLEEKYSHEKVINRKNDLLDYFPATGKVKNGHEREELLNREYKVKGLDNAAATRKMSTIEFEYINVADKVCGRKNVEKEKGAWPNELKIILKCIKMLVEQNVERFGDDKRVENIFAKVNKQCSLSGTVLDVLVIVQDLFFKSKNKRIEAILFENKKVLIAFFDYYRK